VPKTPASDTPEWGSALTNAVSGPKGSGYSRRVSPQALLFALACCAAVNGCGCAASPERHEEPAPVDEGTQEAWGARFSVPDGWTGGENDAGGLEFTDGDLALLVGRHALEPEKSLESFLEARSAALSELGAHPESSPRRQRVHGSDVMTVSASAEGGLRVRLLVARLGPREGLSLMMIGEERSVKKLEQAFSHVVGSLVLP
jgi:hypothetical protein